MRTRTIQVYDGDGSQRLPYKPHKSRIGIHATVLKYTTKLMKSRGTSYKKPYVKVHLFFTSVNSAIDIANRCGAINGLAAKLQVIKIDINGGPQHHFFFEGEMGYVGVSQNQTEVFVDIVNDDD